MSKIILPMTTSAKSADPEQLVYEWNFEEGYGDFILPTLGEKRYFDRLPVIVPIKGINYLVEWEQDDYYEIYAPEGKRLILTSKQCCFFPEYITLALYPGKNLLIPPTYNTRPVKSSSSRSLIR